MAGCSMVLQVSGYATPVLFPSIGGHPVRRDEHPREQEQDLTRKIEELTGQLECSQQELSNQEQQAVEQTEAEHVAFEEIEALQLELEKSRHEAVAARNEKEEVVGELSNLFQGHGTALCDETQDAGPQLRLVRLDAPWKVRSPQCPRDFVLTLPRSETSGNV